MRRSLGFALLLGLVAQSSGVAWAGSADAIPSGTDFAALVTAVSTNILNSGTFAFVTGTRARYDAIHAPAPLMERSATTLDAAKLMRDHHALKPRLRHGTTYRFVMPDLTTVDRRHPRRDPLAMRRSTVQPNTMHANIAVGNARVLEPLRSLVPPIGAGPRRPATQKGGRINPMTSGMTGTGIEPWWTYEERAIPGIGKAMLNVATGNLVVPSIDVDIHEQGIDLAFQRVYNSQSLHDVNGDDGGDPSIFGNRWTNSFDASIVYDPVAVTITVYDIDGAACVYTSNGNGGWVPCAGVYATLQPTDGTDCTYMWTKPNGTSYWFHADVTGMGCSIPQSKKGQLAQIIGRNSANSISFAYSYYGQSKTSEDVSEIDAQHSGDNDTLYMYFGIIPGTSINELSEITELAPNQQSGVPTVQYLYDTSGNLIEVDKPGNNSAQTITNPPATLPHGDVPQTYAYASGTSSLQEACGSRCTVAMWNHPNNPNDGGALLFIYSGALQLITWQFQGVLNFTPPSPDPSGAALQSGPPTGWNTFYTADFDYGVKSLCSYTISTGTTSMCDSDGHGTKWTYNGNGNVTDTSDYTGQAEGQWIDTTQAWDSTNDLTAATDANGNLTRYAYDLESNGTSYGNMVEMQLPQLQDITVGGSTITLKPTSYYSYDGSHNITSYCDPVYNQANGYTWISNPSNNPCPGGSNTTRLTYSTPSPEPYGCLTNVKKPSAYSTDITYTGDGTGPCGVGLPTTVEAHSSISQADGTTRQPTQDFGYDSKGNLTSYDKGQGSSGNYQDSWSLYYDTYNFNYKRTENDSGVPNATLNSFTCYYPDGSVFYTETPSQHVADNNPSCPTMASLLSGSVNPPVNAVAYYYDTDGDQVQTIDHKGGATDTSGTTTYKYYDGMDRLVETIMPYDDRSEQDGKMYDCYGGPAPSQYRPWMNRYVYDLSMQGGGASLSIGANSVVAYGGLFKTEEYLPSAGTVSTCGQTAGFSWTDVRGSAFDAFGRVIDKYELAYGNGTAPYVINVYDGTNELGLLSETKNTTQTGSHQTISYIYDAAQRVQEMDFGGPAPTEDTRTYTYDPDGRTATVTMTTLGTMSYTYDVDGNKTQQTDPSNEPNNATINYANYADGLREYVSLTGSNSPIQQSHALQYSYREDGLLDTEAAGWNMQTPGLFQWTYTPGGRELTEADPYSSANTQIGTYYLAPNSNQPITGNVQLRNKTYSYDQFGRVLSLLLPETYNADTYKYDVDDELTGRKTSTENSSGVMTNDAFTYTYLLNARGEMLNDCDNCSSQDEVRSANGTMVDPSSQAWGTNAAIQWDTRSGQTVQNPYSGQGQNQYYYDYSGRQTSDVFTPNQGTQFTYNRTYDAENHIVSAPTGPSCNIPHGSYCLYHDATLSWGPDGQLRGICQNPSGNQCAQSVDLHWDGTTLLFATTTPQGGGAATNLYVGKLGITFNGGGYYVADRNQNGVEEAWHTQYAFGPWNGFSYKILGTGRQGISGWWTTNWGSCYNQGSYSGCPNQGGYTPSLGIDRSDGYTYMSFAVQGVRTYDSTSQQWLTPDAYAGDVHEPVSQKPFIWNGNNPLEYADPTGYDPTVSIADNGAGGETTITIHYKFNIEADQGVTDDQIKQFLSNVESYSGEVAGVKVVVQAEVASPDDHGVDTTTVHLENSANYTGRDGGAPANGGPGHGNITRFDGKVWDVRVGTDYYGNSARTRYAQGHEVFHNAGASHHFGNGDVMGAWSGSATGLTRADVIDITLHANLQPPF